MGAGRPVALISGGETSVVVGRTAGRGGRNQNYALALAIALRGHPEIHAFAGDSDGIDGDSTLAGVMIFLNALARCIARSLDPAQCLHDCNSTSLAVALKGIYRAVDAKTAEEALSAFEASEWGQKYPAIGQSWRRAWSKVIPFFAFPEEVRRIVYTTNAIEALNAQLRLAVRARGHFPSDEAATKLLYLILNRSEKEWRMPPREWSMAKAQFAVLFGERFIKAMAC